MSFISLTNNNNFQVGLSLFSEKIQAQDGLNIAFEFASYGGNGADGITFFLMDAATTSYVPGGSGGALGYSPRVTDPVSDGLTGAYLGVGFDSFGNFSNPIEGSVTGPGFLPDAIAVRGSEAMGYAYLTGTETLPSTLDNLNSAATRETSKKRAQIEFSPTGDLSIFVDLNGDGDFADASETAIQNFNVFSAGNGALPEILKFGFTAATGRDTHIHEIHNVIATTFTGQPLAGTGHPSLTLLGDVKDDDLIGGNGHDTLNGGSGNDQLTGLAGDDLISGGDGRDRLDGGVGSDTLVGNDGADIFVYSGRGKNKTLRLSRFKGKHRDVISDFDQQGGDRILLDFNANSSKTNAPKKLFNVGKVKGRHLKKAIKAVYKDCRPDKLGQQSLKKNQAFLVEHKRNLYLGVNDRNHRFSQRNDLFLDLGENNFDLSIGRVASNAIFM